MLLRYWIDSEKVKGSQTVRDKGKNRGIYSHNRNSKLNNLKADENWKGMFYQSDYETQQQQPFSQTTSFTNSRLHNSVHDNDNPSSWLLNMQTTNEKRVIGVK